MTDPMLQGDPAELSAAELAVLADSYAGLRKRKAELNRLADEVASDAEQIKKVLLAAMKAQGLSVIGGNIASVKVKEKRVYRTTDWHSLYEYIRLTGEFDLLHRRLSDAAVAERVAAGENLPGVGELTIRDLSVSQA